MSKQLVFERKFSPQRKIENFIRKYDLIHSYADRQENIYLSDYIIMSVTKRVVWILLIDHEKHLDIEADINNYFTNGR